MKVKIRNEGWLLTKIVIYANPKSWGDHHVGYISKHKMVDGDYSEQWIYLHKEQIEFLKEVI